ncbi:homocitrate synthase [Chloroflexota bacterium]
MGKIYLIDVTNREGVQTANFSLPKLAKTIINIYLNEMGVFQSEFGFPTIEHESNYLRANLKLTEMGALQPMRLGGWIRAKAEDIKKAFQLVPEIKYLNLSIPTSKQMIKGKFLGRKSKEDILMMAMEAIDIAKAFGALCVGINAEDASRTDTDYLLKFASLAKEHGADRFRYCDTLGYDNPFTIYKRSKLLAKKVGMPIELHCHDDLGMAVANSVAGAMGSIDGGQDAYINTTINGIGERAGNADLVSVVLALQKSKYLSKKYNFGMPIYLSNAWKTCRYTSYASSVYIPVNQPGIGANAFAYASGIHTDGMLKDTKNYELYGFEELGRGEPEIVETGREICFGEYSGVSSFQHIMGKMDINFENRNKAEEVLELVRYANVLAQKPIVADELYFIAKHPDISRKLLTLAPLK